MRNARWLAMSTGLLLSGAAVHPGCSRDTADCTLSLSCPGAVPVLDPACVGEPRGKAVGPSSECGVFASPTAPADGDGSRESPFGSLQAALDQAAMTGQPVYACGKEFAENVHVPSGVTLYGSLDCDADWVWTAGKPTVLKPAASAGTKPGGSEIAMVLDPGKGTVITDVDVIAADGVATGVSSIAVLVNGTAAQLSRCTFTAGNGTDAAAGADGSADPADLAGLAGNAGLDVCATGADSPGGAAMVRTCGAGSQSVGGKGGDGGSADGTSTAPGVGGNGWPASASAPTAGRGGHGETSVVCTAGSDGAKGADGAAGAGADGKALGSLSLQGFTGAAGKDGTDGVPGQGGGGGGGAKGAMGLACGNRVGASGGSGGTGGCGGPHGSGGLAGGSSLALVSVKATLTLDEVTLVAQRGGSGGGGGKGQGGGGGGAKGTGGTNSGTSAGHACDGGYGGGGGNGGPGGGGRGGHSIGLAYTGALPLGARVKATGTPGAGGPGGTSNGLTGGQGAAGVAAATQAFP